MWSMRRVFLVSGSRSKMLIVLNKFEEDGKDGVEELRRKVTEIIDIWVKRKNGLRAENRFCNNTS